MAIFELRFSDFASLFIFKHKLKYFDKFPVIFASSIYKKCTCI